METVLITGAGGFIASSLIDNLLRSSNYHVVGFDNNWKNSCDTLIPFIPDSNFEFIMGDVTDPEDIKKVFSCKPEYVIHLAALVGFPICRKYRSLAYMVNVGGTRNVMNEAWSHKSKVLFSSTGSVYKPGQDRCDETAEVDPPSDYGITKVRGESIVHEYNDTIIFRFGTAMGLSKNSIRVNLLANDLTYQSYINRTITLFEHTFLRSFIHVRDIANAIFYTICNWDRVYSRGRLFNVSNNNLNFTKGELAEMIAAKLGTHVCYAEVGKDLDQRNYLMDNSLFYETGWRPFIDMDKTLDELIKVAPLLTRSFQYQ